MVVVVRIIMVIRGVGMVLKNWGKIYIISKVILMKM